ncbi:MAG: tetratricopeptide repeat protein [Cyanobacteria bacterium J06621_12]
MNSNTPSLTGWSTEKSNSSSASDFTNLGLIHVPQVGDQSIELVSDSRKEFVLLPEIESTPESSLPVELVSASEVYIGQAVAYFEQNKFDSSIAACQEALRVNPEMGVAYKVWGNCLQRDGKSAEAIGIYAKALEAKADMAEIYSNLGSIYARQKKWQQAIEHYQKSIIINPNLATPHRNLARIWDELKEYDKSAESFFKAINLEPSLLSAQNHFSLANNLVAEGNRSQAIACYESCVELEPNFLNAYARLADALEEEGQTESALFYYKKLAQLQTETRLPPVQSKSAQQISALLQPGKNQGVKPATRKQLIKLPADQTKTPQLQPAKPTVTGKIEQYLQAAVSQPNSASIQGELGNLYLASKQKQKAIACYLKATKLAPQEVKYHLSLGRAWEQAGNSLRANTAYYRGFSLKPQDVSAKNHYQLGDKLLGQNEIKKAIACYRRAISKQPRLIQAYWRLGEIATEKNDPKTALACYQRALKIAPNRVQNYILVAKTLARQGNWEAALAYYRKAATVEPDNAGISIRIGAVLINLQRYEAAIKILQQAVSKRPQSWEAYYQLGNALSQQKLWQKAIGAYEKAILFNPDFSLAYYYLGQAHLELQQWQQGKKAFEQAIELNPNSSWSYYGLGSALNELQQWEKGAEALSNSVRLNPNFDWAYHKLGDARTKIKDWSGAASAYGQALTITPDLAPCTKKGLEYALQQSSTADLPGTTAETAKAEATKEDVDSSLLDILTELPNEPEVYLSSSDSSLETKQRKSSAN